MSLRDKMDRFLDSQALQSSLRAALQRNKLYNSKEDMRDTCKANGTTFNEKNYDKTKEEFRSKWKKLLRETGRKYRSQKVESDEYFQDLLDIQNKMQGYISGLGPIQKSYFQRFKFSHAQKSLSLYLKYRWCQQGWCDQSAPPPPFLPLDRKILDQLNRQLGNGRTIQRPWTEISSEEFEKFRDMKKPAEGWAEWELGQWNEIFADEGEEENGEGAQD